MIVDVIGNHEQGCALQLQLTGYVVYNPFVALRDAGNRVVTLECVECNDKVVEDVRYLVPFLFSAQHFLLEISELYLLNDIEPGDCTDMTECPLERCTLLVMWLIVSLRVIAAQQVRLTERSKVQVVAADEFAEAATQDVAFICF